ncbi:MAG: phosphotransferase [Planctomycetes bacterium]|nr:phosphotransferase [Planctomycetota bacterium]
MIDFDAKFDRPALRPPPSPAEVAALLDAEVEALEPLAGGYTNINLRVRLAGDPAWKVLRLRERDPEGLAREVALLGRVAERVPAPRVLAHGGASGRPWALLTWIDGRPLADALADARLGPKGWAAAARATGEVLARIHGVRFAAAGFLDARLEVARPLGDLGAAFLDFFAEALADARAAARLGPALVERTRAHVRRHGGLLADLEETSALVHSDFNAKNLLVREVAGRLEVAAVLDWEFAFSGSPLVDLGNFLRFAHERPPEVEAAFVAGYEAARGARLPREWRRAATLLDLTALLEMLTREQAGPRTLRTARDAIARAVGG